MKLYRIFSALIIIFCNNCFANEYSCSVTFYPKIYYAGHHQELSSDSFLKHSDCAIEIQRKMLELIAERSGIFHASYLQKLLKDEFPKTVIHIKPVRFEIYKLLDFLNKEIKLPDGHTFTNVNILKSIPVLALESNTRLNAFCNNCDFTGSKNIKLTEIIDHLRTKKEYWVSATAMTAVRALVAQEHLNVSHQPLSKNLLRNEHIYSERPEQFFTDLSQIAFYKLNKALPEGTPVRVSDLTSLDLVRVGFPTQVIIFKNNIALSSSAMPLRSGKINEQVQLRLINKKTITGKIIDHNKVMVEL